MKHSVTLIHGPLHMRDIYSKCELVSKSMKFHSNYLWLSPELLNHLQTLVEPVTAKEVTNYKNNFFCLTSSIGGSFVCSFVRSLMNHTFLIFFLPPKEG